ncbi:MAG: 5-(carboxyamino)imidazole ribonucleotide mutase, partial [Propionibacterium sp.]|nr:5-(carboxyamino)imidazole ribonucleotide mutase [Propionibacterium sp.]NLT31564.1 5-(carboxyamino)imidazole ribonucleotide mutase [Propionibacterium sp.]
LAARILSVGDEELIEKMIDFQDDLRRQAEAKGERVRNRD